MTETDVQCIQEIVDQIHIDPKLELEWIDKQLAEMRKLQQETACFFKLHRFLRKDEAMKANATTLKDIQAIIAYLESQRANLAGSNGNGD